MFIILSDVPVHVKEPTHLSQRVGHVVPGVVVCFLSQWCVMVGRVNARRYSVLKLGHQLGALRFFPSISESPLIKLLISWVNTCDYFYDEMIK